MDHFQIIKFYSNILLNGSVTTRTTCKHLDRDARSKGQTRCHLGHMMTVSWYFLPHCPTATVQT